jgi:predicted Zn-dependent protease
MQNTQSTPTAPLHVRAQLAALIFTASALAPAPNATAADHPPATQPAKSLSLRPAANAGPEVNLAEDVPLSVQFKEAAQILALVDANKMADAKELAQALVQKHPNDPIARVLLIQVYRKDDALFAVRQDIDRIPQLGPSDPRVIAELAMVHGWDGQFAKGIKLAEDGLKKYPNSASLLETQGRLLNALDKTAQTIECLQKPAAGLKEPSGRAAVHVVLASALEAEQKNDQALAAVNIALAGRPRDTQALQTKARLLDQLGQPEQAYDLYITLLRNPGKIQLNPNQMKDLRAHVNRLKPAAMQAKLKQRTENRQHSIDLASAYQSNPADPKAKEDLTLHTLGLCEALGIDPLDSLIPLEDHEKSSEPSDKADIDVIHARDKAEKMFRADRSINTRFDSPDQYASALPDLEKIIAVYPSPYYTYLIAMIHFRDKRYALAADYAALSAGVSSLEHYQLPLDESQAGFTFLEDQYVKSRRLALEAARMRDETPDKQDLLLQDYLAAVAAQDWVKVCLVCTEGEKNLNRWCSRFYPAAEWTMLSHYKYKDKIEKAMVAKGNALLRDKRIDALKSHMQVMALNDFSTLDAMELSISASQTFGDAQAATQAIAAALDLYPYSPVARYALAMDAEKRGQSDEAMLQYNAGAAGKNTNGLAGMALGSAASRDLLEKKLGNSPFDRYAKLIDAERAKNPITKERRGLIIAALTRLLADKPKNPTLHLIRGQERHRIGDYQNSITDLLRAEELDPNLRFTVQPILGDAYAGISRQKNIDPETRRENIQKSLMSYTFALDIAPQGFNTAALRYARGMRSSELGLNAQALTDLAAAIDLFEPTNKNRAWAHLELSKLYELKGDKDKARSHAAKALDASKSLWTKDAPAPEVFAQRVQDLGSSAKTPTPAGDK